MTDIRRKRKLGCCNTPDVPSILKKFEKKRKVKVNKNVIIKFKPIAGVKSNLKSDRQSTNIFLDDNKTDIAPPLITENYSQAVAKTNYQEKKPWQPPTKQCKNISPQKDVPNSDKNTKECDADYTICNEKNTDNINNCYLQHNKSSFEEVTEGTTESLTKPNKQTHEIISQTLFSDNKLAALNENKACNENTNVMSENKVIKHCHSCDDILLNNTNTFLKKDELTESLSTSCTKNTRDDKLECYEHSSQLENNKNNSTNLGTTRFTEFTELNKKNNVNECSQNNPDISEKTYGYLYGETKNLQDGIHISQEKTLINNLPTFPNNSQYSKHKQEKCLNIVLDNHCQTNTVENDAKYDEYDDEEITITHSQLNHIENEFSKTKINNIVTHVQTFSDSIKQQQPVESYSSSSSSSFKVLWKQKVEDDGKKLRRIVQELRKINDSLLKVRNEIWPSSRNNSSILSKTTDSCTLSTRK